MRAWLVMLPCILISIAPSCSSSDSRPPSLGWYDSSGGSPGDSGAKGGSAGASGKDSGAKESGTGGVSGSGGEGGASGSAGSAGAPAACAALDPQQVYLLGNTVEGDGRDAIASFAHPESPCILFETHNEDAARIRPDGRVVWQHWNDGLLWVYVPDAFTWDSSTQTASQPDYPQSNDDAVPTPACATPDAGAFDGNFLVSVQDGSVVYRCANGGNWYDTAGTKFADGTTNLASIGYDGLKLAYTTQTNGILTVINGQGAEAPVQGPATYATLKTVRARNGGFWAVYDDAIGGSLELWEIDAAGQGTLAGTYADPPAGATSPGTMRIDGQGNVFQFAKDATDTTADAVIKRPLKPGTSEVVYSEKNLPDNDWGVNPPKVYVRIHISGFLTGS